MKNSNAERSSFGTVLKALLHERYVARLLRRDVLKLLDDIRRLRAHVARQDALIARLRAEIECVKREYMVPPYHRGSTIGSPRTLFREGGCDDAS